MLVLIFSSPPTQPPTNLTMYDKSSPLIDAYVIFLPLPCREPFQKLAVFVGGQKELAFCFFPNHRLEDQAVQKFKVPIVFAEMSGSNCWYKILY